MAQCSERIGGDDLEVAYREAAQAGGADDPYRLSAVARLAALYEDAENWRRALDAYRDLIQNADDPQLVAAARDRADELESVLQ
jgi:hypothetical protein